MGIGLFIVVVVNAAIFAVLGGIGIRYAVRDQSPRIRVLAGAFAAVCAAFVLGASTRAAALAVRQGWLPGRVGDFLVSEWHVIQSIVATVFGLVTLWLLLRIGPPIRRADHIVAALSDRFRPDSVLAEAGLTAREQEVLDVIATGTLSDKEIAEALFISPATAGTHVKNILKKVGVSSRRDLVLLVAAQEAALPDSGRRDPTAR